MDRLGACAPNTFKLFVVSVSVFVLLIGIASAGARWQPLGPDGAGVTLDLVIDPVNPSILYLGGGNGVFKSVDGGETWRSASRGLRGQVAVSLAIDPLTPSTIYAVTSRRVFKSTDGGARWFGANCGIENELIREIDIDRQNPATLYAATRNGVYKTTNGGSNWAPSANGLTSLDVQALRVAPSNSAVVYAATSGGVFRSDNRGASWQPVNGGLTDLRTTLLRVNPTNPMALFAGTFDGLFRTTDGGDSWQLSQNGLQGGTPFSLAYDRQNTNVVYAGAIIDGIFKTTNGGVTWSPVNNGVIDGGRADFGITAMAVHPQNSNLVFAATLDGGPGVFRSVNAGGLWTPSGRGLAIHRVLDIIFNSANPNTVYAAMDDRNGIYRSLDGGDTWQQMNNGFQDQFGLFANLPLSLTMDPSNQSTLYLGSNGDGLFRTRNSALNWDRLSHSLLNNRFISAVKVDPNDSRVVYAATSDGGVVKTVNEAISWAFTGPQITAVVEGIDIDPVQSSRVYAVTSMPGGVFRSENGGGLWSQISNGLGEAAPVELAIDPDNASTLYLGTRESGVFRSDDRGENWRPVNNGLGGVRVESLAAAPGVLYLGARSRGVYRSRDGGATWTAAAFGLQNRVISALAIHPSDSETVLAGLNFGSILRRVDQPSYLYAAGRVDEFPQFDGLAFSNFSLEGATLGLEQIDSLIPASSGEIQLLDSSPAGSLDAMLFLSAGLQAARTRIQLFPGSSDQSAWLQQSSDVSEVASFFQFGSSDLVQLDGGIAITEPLTRFLFTRVFEGPTAFRGQRAVTRLSVFNPNNSPVTVQLSYFPLGPPPGPPARQIVRDIPARSYLEGTFSQLFQTGSQGGYILGQVTAGGGVTGFELIHLPDRRTILGLNAASTLQPGRSYSAQLASQAGIFTNLNLVNSSNRTRRVALRAIDEDGSQIGQTRTRMLNAGEQASIDAGSLVVAGPGGFVGSLAVEADGDGVAGDVIFGDPVNFAFAAALPLQSEAFTEAVFSQVANVPGFFTGLAFFYPGSPFERACAADAELTIEVVRADGSTAGTAVRQLAAGERLSQLVPELVPDSAGQAGGYIRLSSSQPLIAQMLFGALDGPNIRLFSAVPPAVVR